MLELARLELTILDFDEATLETIDELRELELKETEDDAPTIPKGAGCELQVTAVIQLLLFS